MIRQIKEKVSYGEYDSLRKRILAKVDKQGSVTAQDIYKNLHNCPASMAKDALDVLSKSGDLIQTKDGRWIRPKKG